MTSNEGVLDPWVADWFEANPMAGRAFDDLTPENLALARGPVGFPVTREIASVTDDVVDGIPVRVYQGEQPPTGVIVYFHGGGFCIGSIGLMDNVARELDALLRRGRRVGRVPPRAREPLPGRARRL